MRLTWVLATVLAAVVVQTVLARYTVGGEWVFDFVLVGVVLAALQWGPVAGILAGTVGGLLQDLLGGGILGVGGLAKTLVGYAAGQVSVQFVFVRASSRALIVALATVAHRAVILAVMALIELEWARPALVTLLVEVGVNALAAVVAFHLSQAVPGLVERRWSGRRSSLSRRQW